MLIDFRIRPRFGSFLNMDSFAHWTKPEPNPRKLIAFGAARYSVPSRSQKSMELFIADNGLIKHALYDSRKTVGNL